MSRDLTRWIATCEQTEPGARGVQFPCPFNDRKDPDRHTTAAAAQRESRDHILQVHLVPSAREVVVRRTYTPRTVASEEIVGA